MAIPGAMLLGWILMGLWVIPQIIEAAYRGEDWPIVSQTLRALGDQHLDFYQGTWRLFFWAATVMMAGLGLLIAKVGLGTLKSTWRDYWFRPSPVGFVAVARVVCVGVQLLLLFSSGYNPDKIRMVSELPNDLYSPLPALEIFLWPWSESARPSLSLLLAAYWGTLAVGVTALVGLWTNFSLLLFALGCTFLQAFYYSFGDLHHPEALMIIALWILALSPAGRALSADSLLAGRGSARTALDRMRESSRFAAWPLLLIQWLIYLVYFDSGIRKVVKGGIEWMNGYTLQYYLFDDGLRRGSDVAVWLASKHSLVQAASILTIFFELTFWVVLLFPRLAWLYVILGIGFHLGCCVCKIACFYQFMALYVVFLPQLSGCWKKSPLSSLKSMVLDRK